MDFWLTKSGVVNRTVRGNNQFVQAFILSGFGKSAPWEMPFVDQVSHSSPDGRSSPESARSNIAPLRNHLISSCGIVQRAAFNKNDGPKGRCILDTHISVADKKDDYMPVTNNRPIIGRLSVILLKVTLYALSAPWMCRPIKITIPEAIRKRSIPEIPESSRGTPSSAWPV
ncbi:hypothetical protein B0H13DRAFT_1853211 [Mycena leptocephala]|nr:hypothetical protein B0H13DRAFT_1853211 [Mycena leptocephala]